LHAGWTTYETPEYFKEFGGGSRFASRMALLGCHDFAPYFAIHEMLEYWKREGAEKIMARIRELGELLDGLVRGRLGWKCVSPPLGPRRGPLLAYELPPSLAARGRGLMRELALEHGVQTLVIPAPRREAPEANASPAWWIRFSPHVYNTEAELERAVASLPTT
jgi:selenocysteine lyase/cysteine desulfurase